MNRQIFSFPLTLAHLLLLQRSLAVKSGLSPSRSRLLTPSYSPLHSPPLSMGKSPAQGTKTIRRNQGATRHPRRRNGTNGKVVYLIHIKPEPTPYADDLERDEDVQEAKIKNGCWCRFLFRWFRRQIKGKEKKFFARIEGKAKRQDHWKL
jgi:hypothetical protein